MSASASPGASRRQRSSPEDRLIRIAIVDENPLRSAIIEAGLREAGYGDIVRIERMTALLKRIEEIAPDVILIDLENPSRDALENMFTVSRTVSRPVAMFVDQSDTAMIEAAVEAGVSAYIVDGLKKERVKAILDMAITRFHVFDRLKRELADTKSKLEDRKIIDRAKGIVMKAKSLSEEEAYALMRRAAMRENRRIADVARSIVTTSDLLQ